jgi:septum formation protein
MSRRGGAVLHLASSSPRRRALLEQIGVPYEVVVVGVDEAQVPGEAPRDYVSRLALAKARAVWSLPGREPRLPVLAADTTVVLDGQLLGKPGDRAEALGMLAKLSGREHEVLSAVALITAGIERAKLSVSAVTFREITPDERERYWESGEPRDKAGGYAIQGLGAAFVADLRGSFSGVMGLPLYETAQLLREAGLPYWCTMRP